MNPFRRAAVFLLLIHFFAVAARAVQVSQVNTPALWKRSEFLLSNVPAAANPFDPDNIKIDATFTLPSGSNVVVPAFWFQGYSRVYSGGAEVLYPINSPEWRVRFAPPEPGLYTLSVSIKTNGQLYGPPAVTNFTVAGAAPSRSGFVRLASSRQYFETGDGQPLRLIGENVCWPGARGTFDYDDWFPAMKAVGENHARIWMCPWAFGLETEPDSLTHYRLDHAWDLDYVLQLAEQTGIYLELCLDYHGMYETDPDPTWGGNNYWPTNPYNTNNGGPCVNQNGFFTNAAAATLYQKRLRYLIGRYGYSPNLEAWQFFNEIDNEYSHLNSNYVAAWHGAMGAWLHTNDPFGHLVTTSLTGSSDRPEIWTLPQMDFANYHAYGEPGPATRLSQVAQSFLARYKKPVMIDEFGSDWRGWNRPSDPFLRGFRQGLWGGALGGSVGSAISWWWETIHGENDYSLYSSMAAILNRTGWGVGAWTNLTFQSPGDPPVTVGQTLPGGQPFGATLLLGTSWAATPPGLLALADANAASSSAAQLNAFFHGTGHPDLRVPCRISLWLTNNARLIMHLNSVSDGAMLTVKSDNILLFRTNLANLDGSYVVNNEYNIDLPVNLPAGKHIIDISNAGGDWFYLDSIRFEQVLPSAYSNNWTALPGAIGLRGAHESLLYVVAPNVSFPANATNAALPLQHAQALTSSNWPAGLFHAEWYDPATAASRGHTEALSANGVLALPMPDYTEDLAAIVYAAPRLLPANTASNGAPSIQFESETGGRYTLQKSTNLSSWTTLLELTNLHGSIQLPLPFDADQNLFFRAVGHRP